MSKQEHFTSITPFEQEHKHPECGCKLLRDENNGNVRFFQCKLHEAAPQMLPLIRSYRTTYPGDSFASKADAIILKAGGGMIDRSTKLPNTAVTMRHNGFGVDVTGGPANVDMAMLALNTQPKLLEACELSMETIESMAARSDLLTDDEAAATNKIRSAIDSAKGAEPAMHAPIPGGPTNADRAAWAEEALNLFCARTGLVGEDVRECGIADLIADLMHLAADWDLDPLHEVDRAQNHYDEEVAEEAEENNPTDNGGRGS